MVRNSLCSLLSLFKHHKERGKEVCDQARLRRIRSEHGWSVHKKDGSSAAREAHTHPIQSTQAQRSSCPVSDTYRPRKGQQVPLEDWSGRIRAIKWEHLRPNMRAAHGSRYGDLSYALGGYKDIAQDGELSKWKPNVKAVRATIEFVLATKRLDYVPSRDTQLSQTQDTEA
ncbi:hypothetical protein BJ546DRAFT_952096 [Cryomyces antarcticus]